MLPSSNKQSAPRPASPARLAVLEVLRHAYSATAPGADLLLDQQARNRSLSPEDAALARELTFGVLRRRLWLERVLERYMEHPPGEASVHQALLAGVYQRAFMERIPPHAIVDETVRLVADQPGGTRYRALANAVMRKVASSAPEELRPAPEEDWRVRLSVPTETAEIIGRAIPASELEPFFAACNEPAPLCIRPSGAAWRERTDAFAERLRTEIQALDRDARIERGAVVRDCFRVGGRGIAPERLPLFTSGEAAVEDEGAQAVALIAAAAQPGARRVLDLCAAPGGKTAHLADLLPEARIIATDVKDDKLRRLTENIGRLHFAARVETAVASDFLASVQPESFDLVLVDAPCSGFGTLRRHPEIRYRRNQSSVEQLARLQINLLNAAAGQVRPGGSLVFSVCTITHEEGEGVRDAFLAANGRFAAEMVSVGPEGESSGTIWRTLTHRNGCDSFTVCCFRRSQ